MLVQALYDVLAATMLQVVQNWNRLFCSLATQDNVATILSLNMSLISQCTIFTIWPSVSRFGSEVVIREAL